MIRRTLRWIVGHPTASVGALLCLVMVASAIGAPILSPADPLDQNIIDKLTPPGADYWLGTDDYGRDVLSRLLWGAQFSLLVSFLSVASAMLVGGTIGLVSGYVGGRTDVVIMQVMDVLLSFPSLILGLIIVALVGPAMSSLVFAIALTAVAPFARVARAPVLSLRNRAYVEAGRALGFSHARILFVHILPNMIAEVLVMATLWMADAVRTEAALSFLGLGIKPPAPSWGSMLRDGFENILDAPWLSIFPGIAILLLVLGLNMLGDGLRDATDPMIAGQ
jgi:peptide/nickel transport system permease protein